MPTDENNLRPFAHGDGGVTVTTKRGRAVRIRHITAQDDDLLVELYRRLSNETRRLRFMSIHHDMPDEVLWREAHRLSDLNPHLAAALIGTVREADGAEHAVGVARLARDADNPATAEMAIVIRDDFQRDGLGSAMLDLLIQVGLASGLTRIRAVSLAENVGIQRLIQRAGLPVSTTTSHGETTQIITLI
ncbi:MAG TPA: GNAT family N-acetyltransferase [Roseiflexaceae bacterium]|nr:GNAT family N-acetyltransferase [Roseiflexaceae bacterium]